MPFDFSGRQGPSQRALFHSIWLFDVCQVAVCMSFYLSEVCVCVVPSGWIYPQQHSPTFELCALLYALTALRYCHIDLFSPALLQ